MKAARLIITLIYFLLQTIVSQSQNAYQISVSFGENPDSVFYLAHYYGDKFYIADTSFSSKGMAIFTGDELLKQGIYLIANQKKEKLIEFLVGAEQHFSISTGLPNSENGVVVVGSEENTIFFDHINLVNQTQKLLQQKNAILNAPETNESQKEIIRNEIDSLNQKLLVFRTEIIQQHPTLLISKVLSAMQEPVVPEAIQTNQEAAYQFYKSHYWDHIDLGDDRLLRTPLLPMKLKTYFEQLVLPNADSVIKEVDYLLYLSRNSQETTDFLAWYFSSEYQTPKIMGLDKVFVHLVDHYFLAGKVKNLTPSISEKMKERADKMRLSLIGLKAPDMWLVDTTGNYRSFKEIGNTYTVIIFWDQTCNHCKKEMESLNKFVRSNKYDVGVFAVNATNDFEGWKHYINEKKYPFTHVNGMKSMTADFHDLYDIYSVPVIYLLDKNKTIIGKRISADQLENIIKTHQEQP